MKILVTGTAGFIGSHVARALLERGDEVVGLDSINDYYDVDLKYARLRLSGIAREAVLYGRVVESALHPGYRFLQLDLSDKEGMEALFKRERLDAVCHLAAQAGVRYSLSNPHSYVQSNVLGFLNILEGCRHSGVENLSYASSSSVYGMNDAQPFSTTAPVDHPISLYAATKKTNELMAHTYSHLFGVRTTGLRFFTVYGPWGRPDMALFIFVRNILQDKPIDVFNHGRMKRDFTYVDDIVDGVVRVVDRPAGATQDRSGSQLDPSCSSAPYRLYNIGRGRPVELLEFIEAVEAALGRPSKRNLLPMQPGDVPETFADIAPIERDLGYRPKTDVREGVAKFVAWYLEYHGYAARKGTRR